MIARQQMVKTPAITESIAGTTSHRCRSGSGVTASGGYWVAAAALDWSIWLYDDQLPRRVAIEVAHARLVIQPEDAGVCFGRGLNQE
jgi:hypothetical protein